MLRDLMVVLDGSPRNAVQLDLAVNLALRHDAHLTGFCPLEGLVGDKVAITAGAYPGIPVFPGMVNEVLAEATEKARLIEEAFHEQLRRNGLNGDWQLATGLPISAVVRRARCADLLVLRQTDPDEKAAMPTDLVIEDALMGAGRPLLVVPYAGQFATIGTNVLIGWDGSREAARAVHDMLPLVGPDSKITVLTIERARAASDESDIPGAEIAAHLAHHGLVVTAVRTVRDASASDADILLNHASDTGADLLVVGGYGHSRAREILLGGVTRSLLHHMTLPVLMSR